MAKRSNLAIRTVRAAAPVIRIAAPRAAAAVKSGGRRAGRTIRRAAGSSAHGMTPISAAVTAAVVGYAESAGFMDKLPSIPVVGRKGTLAIAAWYFSKHGGGKIARDVALIAAVLAGHELGTTGKVSGDDEGEF